MAGFFGFFDMTKPGKGVNKDEPKKKGIARLSELFFRKTGSYIKLNFLYLLTCIPAILMVWFFVTEILRDFLRLQGEDIIAVALTSLIIALVIVMIFGLSPFSSGYFYILRNFVRETHSWVFSDFFLKTKENFKKSISLYVIDLLLTVLTLFSLRLYLILYVSGMSYILILFIFYILMIIIYAVMTPYKWTMVVTFDLKLLQILRNSLLLSCGAIVRTIIYIGATILYLAVFYFIMLKAYIIGLVLFVLFGISLYGLIQELTIYPVINKYLMPEENDNI